MTDIRDDFKAVVSSEPGIRVLKWLMEYCGYQKPLRVLDPQSHEVNTISTACNAVLRDVWIDIRTNIPNSALMLIEHDKPLEQTLENENDDRQHRTSSGSDGSGRKRRDFKAESDKFTASYLAELAADSSRPAFDSADYASGAASVVSRDDD